MENRVSNDGYRVYTVSSRQLLDGRGLHHKVYDINVKDQNGVIYIMNTGIKTMNTAMELLNDLAGCNEVLGFTNHATAAMALLLDNDRGVYADKVRLFSLSRAINRNDLISIRVKHNIKLYQDTPEHRINWPELVDHWNGLKQEYIQDQEVKI